MYLLGNTTVIMTTLESLKVHISRPHWDLQHRGNRETQLPAMYTHMPSVIVCAVRICNSPQIVYSTYVHPMCCTSYVLYIHFALYCTCLQYTYIILQTRAHYTLRCVQLSQQSQRVGETLKEACALPLPIHIV